MTYGDKVAACPDEDCNSATVRRRNPNSSMSHADTKKYYCGDCGNSFDEPEYRERKAQTGPSGLAGKLADDDTELAL